MFLPTLSANPHPDNDTTPTNPTQAATAAFFSHLFGSFFNSIGLLQASSAVGNLGTP
jgi:hypothetical protein